MLTSCVGSADVWALPPGADPLTDPWQPFDIGQIHNASLRPGGDVPPWPADFWTLYRVYYRNGTGALKWNGSMGCCTTSYTGLVATGPDEVLIMGGVAFGTAFGDANLGDVWRLEIRVDPRRRSS